MATRLEHCPVTFVGGEHGSQSRLLPKIANKCAVYQASKAPIFMALAAVKAAEPARQKTKCSILIGDPAWMPLRDLHGAR